MDTNEAPPAVAAKAPDTLTITLRKPVVHPAGDTLTSLEVREPVVGQLLQWADKSGTERDICAVSFCSGLPTSVIGDFAARDFLTAARFVQSFSITDQVSDDEPPAEKTIVLREAIEWSGKTYAEIVLREPSARELIEWEKADGVAGDCKIIEAVSGVPERALHRVRVSQFTEAAAYLSGFFGGSLPAGAAS